MIHNIAIRFRHWSFRATPGTPASSRYNNVWNYICIPRHTFMVWCAIQHRDFTVTAPQRHPNCHFISQGKRTVLCGHHDIQTI